MVDLVQISNIQSTAKLNCWRYTKYETNKRMKSKWNGRCIFLFCECYQYAVSCFGFESPTEFGDIILWTFWRRRCFIGIITTYTLHNRTTVIWSVFSRTNPRISWRAVNRWHFVSHCLRPFYCLNRFFSLYLASLFFDLFCVWISIVDWLCAVHSVIVSVFS